MTGDSNSTLVPITNADLTESVRLNREGNVAFNLRPQSATPGVQQLALDVQKGPAATRVISSPDIRTIYPKFSLKRTLPVMTARRVDHRVIAVARRGPVILPSVDE